MSSQLRHQVVEGFRLSPQQKRVWRLHEAHPSSEFGCQCIVWITGPLDADLLERVITRIATQHEILRTKFAFLEGTSVPVQVVGDLATGLDAVALLRCENESQRYDKVQCMARKEFRRLRELGNAPAFRFVLARTSDFEHALLITASGLCADSAALVNLVRMVQAEYSGQAPGEFEALQYADISEWQNQLLECADDQDRIPYWKSVEFADLAFPRMPFELQRAREASEFTSERIWRTVSSAAVTAFRELAGRCQVPPQTIILSAWQVLLHRTSGMDRFLVGASTDGRVQPELRSSLGLFAKCLPLAVGIDGNPRFIDLLQRVHDSFEVAQYDQLLFAFEPFGVADPSRRRRLFPVVFSYREQPPDVVTGPLSWKIKSLDECLEPYELALTVIAGANSLQLEFAWEPSVFAQEDVELLAGAFLTLLDEIAQGPERRIGDFTMVPTGAVGVVVATPSVAMAGWSPIHEIIEGHAVRLPNQLAVVCEDDQITYAELDRRASVLAFRLEQVGAVTDSVVALVAERSVDFIVGILAVLKAGAAWLPIEPDTPPARIQYMLEQTSAMAVLTQRGLSLAVSEGALPVVYLDEHAQPQIATQLRARLTIHPSQCAYVIFTSGSTGQPKGVAIEHRHITAYIHGLADRVDLGACANFAVVSTLAADLGHTAIFGALSSGGCLHVISATRALSADALGQYFIRNSIDFVKIVPSHLEVLCRSFAESVQLPWRCLLAGGELLTWRLVEMVQQIAPHCAIFNHYGPTETTVGVFCGPASCEAALFQGAGVPIGRPFAGVSAYLLDEQCRPVPAWMPGELYLGGDSVGRGYVGRGDLTADRFLPDPFRSQPGVRMYRTGDLARYRSDGSVEFLGRRDGQIKIRGYRVELGEIEAVLGRCPGVQRVAVVLADDRSQGKHLVAWVAVGSAKITPDELRRFAGQSLPPYMVPQAIVCVDRLKLTSNGKIDRQALANAVPAPSRAEFLGPADEIEESLVAIWRSVLGVERIGVEDNYFSLGGDSLRVIQLVHEARRYGIVIAATDVLSFPTIRQLRRQMQDKGRRELFPDGIPSLVLPTMEMLSARMPSDVTDFYPVSGIQSFMLKHYRPGIFHIQDCFHVSDASFSYSALERAFQAVMDRHPALRTVFDLHSGEPMQWVRSALRCQMKLENVSHLKTSEQEDHITAAVRADLARPFNQEDVETPLFRVIVFQRSTSEFDLVFSCHHAIMDGWGHRVLLNEVVKAYLSCKSGLKPDLGIPDSTCREFTAFQEAVRRSESAAVFWRQYLAGLAQLPFTRSALDDQGRSNGANVLRSMPSVMANMLLNVARQHAVSMQALTLSMWFEIVRELSGQGVAVVGVVANGRSEYLSDPLSAIGLFWNIVPLVSRQALPLAAQAAAVQKDLVESGPYSAYPLTQLLADQAGNELFFSTFRYLNFWNTAQVPKDAGLQLLSARSHDHYPFPLNCSVVVDPDGNGGYVQLDYDPNCFDGDRVSAALDCYYSLLEGVASPLGM